MNRGIGKSKEEETKREDGEISRDRSLDGFKHLETPGVKTATGRESAITELDDD